VPAGLRVVVTCEHASWAVPAELGDLGLSRGVLQSHRGWDEGALPIAESIAAALRAPLFAAKWSRLVADCNRSANHQGVVRRRLDQRDVPGNRIDRAARAARVAKYWAPYRDEVEEHVRLAVRAGPLLHLSVHSFVERLNGIERKNDVGLLHDPDRPREVAFCEALKPPLVAEGFVVRRNFPYFGDTDGVTSWFRTELPASRYLGIEIECNQRLSRTASGQRRLAVALEQALGEVLG